MIVTKFHENRLTIDREISEKHAILVDQFNVTLGIVEMEPSQLAPKPIRPNQIQPTRPNTGSPQYRLAPCSSLTSQRHTTNSPQYRLAPPFLPGAGSQLQLQQRCSVTL